MIEIQQKGKMAIVPKAHRKLVHGFSPFLEGHRRWLSTGDFQFEATPHNCKKALGMGLSVVPSDTSSVWEGTEVVVGRPTFQAPLKNLRHQDEASSKFRSLDKLAIFAEMGTGKTKMAIDRVNKEWCDGKIDAVIILAKKGVHVQWAEGEIEEDGSFKSSPIKSLTQKDIPHEEWAWKGKPIPDQMLFKNDGIRWFSFNFDAVCHKKAAAQVKRILDAFPGRLAFVGDETHYLKSYKASRTLAAIRISEQCSLRIIMTGTPLAKNLEDEWSQFKVLSEDIIGHRYVSTFRSEFCVMGGFEGRSVVGARNLDKFKELTEPHVFRVTKAECLDLPEKQYDLLRFDLSKEQKEAIQELKTTQTFTLPDGTEVFFEGAAPVLGKIQEVSNGFLVHPDGIHTFPNPRMDATSDFIEAHDQKTIIWCRFKMDVENLMNHFGSRALDYFGGTKDRDRVANKAAFINDPSKTILVATTGAMAEGVDGLQTVCSQSLYYSNTFNSIQRWQSEDRIHRIGMGDRAWYGDLIARGCIDYNLMRNLREKKSFSDLVLDVGREFGLNPVALRKNVAEDTAWDSDGETPPDPSDVPAEAEKARSIDWEF